MPLGGEICRTPGTSRPVGRAVVAALAALIACLLVGCGSGGAGQVDGLTGTGADGSRPAPTLPTTRSAPPTTTVTGPTITATTTATVTGPRVTAPAETVTAPGRTVTAPSETVTVTTETSESRAGAAAAGAAAGAAIASSGSDDSEESASAASPPAPAAAAEPPDSEGLPGWAWGLLGAALGAGIIALIVEIRRRRRASG